MRLRAVAPVASGGPSRGRSLTSPDSATCSCSGKGHELQWGGGGERFKHNACPPSLPDPKFQGQGVSRAGSLRRLECGRVCPRALSVSGGSGRPAPDLEAQLPQGSASTV